MKTCTCPHEATRNGFLRTGYNSLCPFHGKPLPEVAVRPVPEHVGAIAPRQHPGEKLVSCEECGTEHPPDVRCEYVDET